MAHLKQHLTIEVPESVMDHLHYSSEDVVAEYGHLGGGAEVYGADGSVLGALVFFPSTSLKSVQGK